MNLLAERVADLLIDAAKERNKDVVTSDKYINFESNYMDDTALKLRDLREVQRKAEEEKERIQLVIDNARKDAYALSKQHNLGVSSWSSRIDPEDALESYLASKKKEAYPDVDIDRNKLLRQIQADILLSDAGDADALIKQTLSKYQ